MYKTILNKKTIFLKTTCIIIIYLSNMLKNLMQKTLLKFNVNKNH